MKNTEKAAIAISAIERREFWPRRLSAKPAQVCRTSPSKSVRIVTRSLNQKLTPRESHLAQKISLNAIMRIAVLAQAATTARIAWAVLVSGEAYRRPASLEAQALAA